MKLLVVLLIAGFFAVIMFPNDDLSDWISTQISKNTGIYVQFDQLGFDLAPPGLEASDVSIEARGVPTIKAGSMHAGILLSKFLTFKLGFTAVAEKVFHGDIDLSYGQGDKTSSGARFDDVTIHADKVSLDDLCDFLHKMNMLSLKLQGNVNLDSSLHVDHLFTDQPSFSASAEIPSFLVPSQSVMVDFNGVPVSQVIPTLDLGHVVLKNAKLSEGILEIPDLTVGDKKSELFGHLKGTMALQMRKLPNGVQPDIKNIDFAMDLTLNKDFIDRNQKTMIGGFLMLIPANLKTETVNGTRLAFHMKLTAPGAVPNFSPLTEKL